MPGLFCVVRAVVPGSHLSPFRPPAPGGDGATKDSPPPVFPEEIRILAQPGQAVMFDSYCFHRGSANTTADRYRRSVFMCYHNAFVAQTVQCAADPPTL